MPIKKSDKQKYQKKVQSYIDGRSRLAPKWIKPPEFNESFLDSGCDFAFTEDKCFEVYPFDKGTTEERKFRILLALRFTSMLGGLSETGNDIKYINEWLRQLLLVSDRLRSKCGIKNWSPPWEVVDIK